jgi:hypothetical protein
MKHEFATIHMKAGEVITTFSTELVQLASQNLEAQNLCQTVAALCDQQWRKDGLTEKSPLHSVAVQSSAEDGRCGWTGILGHLYLQHVQTSDLDEVSKGLLRECTALWALVHPEHKPLEAMLHWPVYEAEAINHDEDEHPTFVRITANGKQYHSKPWTGRGDGRGWYRG